MYRYTCSKLQQSLTAIKEKSLYLAVVFFGMILASLNR